MQIKTVGTLSLAAVLAFSGCTIGNTSDTNTNSAINEDISSGAAQSVTIEPSTDSTATSKTISLSEVASHDSESDCWMAVDGKVYEVTNFIKSHPGGNVIVQGCGKDASRLFSSEHGSSVEKAREQLPPFEIGVLQ